MGPLLLAGYFVGRLLWIGRCRLVAVKLLIWTGRCGSVAAGQLLCRSALYSVDWSP